MERTSIKGNVMLLVTAMIWGLAFVAQSVGMDYVGPFTFNTARSILGGLTLLPVIALTDRRAGRKEGVWGTSDREERRTLLKGGIACGAALGVASCLQQIGIQHTTVGKAAFITALYIVMVPLAGCLFGRRPRTAVWIGVAMAVAGFWLLCMTDGFSIAPGDLLVLCCAAVFTLHILVIDRFAPRVDCVRMSCIQFFVAGLVSLPLMLLTEQPSIGALLAGWLPVMYAGIMSSGVAYTLQIIGQKLVSPAVASLILSLESVFAALSGWLLLRQGLTGRELAGCALVLAAVILAQLPARREKV